MESLTEVRYAGFWVRVAADFVDSFVLILLTWVLEMIVLGALSWVGPGKLFTSTLANYLSVPIYFLLALAYFVWGQYRFGTTLGKRPFGVYVVDARGLGRISLLQSAIRFVGYLASTIPFCVGYLMVAFDPKKRALHDRLAGTVSVFRPAGTASE